MRSVTKKIPTILMVIIVVCTIASSVFSAEYSTTGYRTGSTGTVFLQNNLSNSNIYSNHFVTAVSYWNNAGVLGRSFTVNTSSSSQIYNLDFSTSDEYAGKHEDGVVALTYKWGKTTAYCTCHTTNAFDIVCNDALFNGQSTNYKRAVIVHELGHTLGLIDYSKTNGNVSIMSYRTDFNTYCTPFAFDIRNATDCWAPHYS